MMSDITWHTASGGMKSRFRMSVPAASDTQPWA
jgi:hypothetical protein